LQAARNGATEAGLSSAFKAQHGLDTTASRLAEAKKPINNSVNYCFSPNGIEMVAHTVQGWVEQAPEKPKISDDLVAMYDSVERPATFKILQERTEF
jgi:hypothetical protein